MVDENRRNFLKLSTRALLAASGVLGLDSLLRYLSYSPEPPRRTEFALGAASAFPLGSRTVLPQIPAVLIHNEDGFSALSLVCPHLGCTVEDSKGGLICLCHGSRFDPEGAVQRGPAAQALRALRVEITADDQLRLFLT